MADCVVCGAGIDNSNVDDPVQSLLCMHTFHVYCLHQMVIAKNDGTLKCPMCQMEQTPSVVLQIKECAKDLPVDLQTTLDDDQPATPDTVVFEEVADVWSLLTRPAEPAQDLFEVLPPPAEPSAEPAQDRFEALPPLVPSRATKARKATAVKSKPRKPPPVKMAKNMLKSQAQKMMVRSIIVKRRPQKMLEVKEQPAGMLEVANTLIIEQSTSAGMATFPANTLICHTCGSEVHRDKCRLVAKMAEKFRCFECCTSVTQLHRSLGSWPPAEMEKQGLEAKQEFMRSVKGLSGSASADKARVYIKSFETHESRFRNGGAFWPLSKWAADGFDADAIERLTPLCDQQRHDILGRCYRVKIMEKEEAGARGTTKGDNIGFNEKLDKLMDALAKKSSAASSSAPAADESGASKAASDSDSSDSSSSSSSSGKNKKKRKKMAKKRLTNKRQHLRRKRRRLRRFASTSWRS